jgi:lipopolysaccharide export LptBFGC system permease protein LptF
MKKGMLVACFVIGLLVASLVHAANNQGAGQSVQQARAAVAAAEAAVQAAAEQRALWTTAQDALREARNALAQDDYAAAERLSRFAAEQARLGIQQLGYPHFR